MDGSTALAILDKKINSVESTVQSVTLGSDKKSIVITTVDGVSFSVSIPNAVDNPTLLNKFTVANGELYYDGKRIAEYTEIPTATSQLTNDSGFITSASLPNLTPYQPKNDTTLNTTNKTVVGAINELKTNVNNINVPTKTSQLTNDSGYITNSDIPTIPIKVSQLTNDSNYVTQIEMTDAIADAVSGGTVDLTGYQKSRDTNLATTDKTVVGAINELKDNIDNFEGGGAGLTAEQLQKLETAYEHSQSTHVSVSDIPTKVSDLENDSSFVTQTEMTNAINNAQLGGGASGEIDLSNYQQTTDSSLNTTSKEVVGAINEVNSKMGGVAIYTDLTQLKLTSGVTIATVFNSMPNNSMLRLEVNNNTEVTDIPTNASGILMIDKGKTSTGFDIQYKISSNTGAIANTLYTGQLQGSDGSGLTWRRICTTSIEDSKGTITFTMPSNITGVTNGCYGQYTIRDGWCFASFTIGISKITSTSSTNYAQIATGFPSPTTGIYPVLYSENGVQGTQITLYISSSGVVKILAKGNTISSQDFYLGMVTYPVKET